jgi:hypothetical protein
VGDVAAPGREELAAAGIDGTCSVASILVICELIVTEVSPVRPDAICRINANSSARGKERQPRSQRETYYRGDASLIDDASVIPKDTENASSSMVTRW